MGSLPPAHHTDVSRNHFAALPYRCAAGIYILAEQPVLVYALLLSPRDDVIPQLPGLHVQCPRPRGVPGAAEPGVHVGVG